MFAFMLTLCMSFHVVIVTVGSFCLDLEIAWIKIICREFMCENSCSLLSRMQQYFDSYVFSYSKLFIFLLIVVVFRLESYKFYAL